MPYHLLSGDDHAWSELAAAIGIEATPMPDDPVWRSGEHTIVHNERARAYIEQEPELAPYAAIILHDWPNMAEHLAWACTSPVANVVRWARALECRIG